MKILQLAPRFPYPLIDGGATGIYKIAEGVAAAGNQVTFLTFPHQDPAMTKEGMQKLSAFADVRLTSAPLPSRYATLARTAFRGAYPVMRRVSEEMFSLLERTIVEVQPEVIHVDHSHMAKYVYWLKEHYDLPVVLRQHNFENVIYKRFAAYERNPIKKFVASTHGKRLLEEEIRLLNAVDRVVAISEEDKVLMQAVAPSARYEVIPAGVDTGYFQPSDPSLEEPDLITWIGGLDWDPNLDAVSFFLEDIFPVILQRNPKARLELIGNATDAVAKQAARFGDRVKILGRVPDIRSFLARASVLIVPLRIGGGMRLKLLDFFAAGKAVVSTRIGAEGNIAQDAVHLLLRDSAEDFVTGVLGLLANPKQRQEFAFSARALVEEKYSWKRIGLEFTRVYEELRQGVRVARIPVEP